MRTRIIGALIALILTGVGAFVLINYVRSADIRAANGAQFIQAYVVEKPVPAGTAGERISEYIAIKEIPALAAVDGRVTDLDELEGLQTDVSLVPGEQLLLERWIDPEDINSRGEATLPDGMQAMSLALPVERVVGGSVQPGDTVGVIITSEAETPEGQSVLLSKQAFHKVLVLSVQGGTTVVVRGEGETESSDPVDALVVTVALSTPDVEVMAWGQQFGAIWLTLEPEGADEGGGRTVDGNIVYQ